MKGSKKEKRLDSADRLAQVYEQYTPELRGFIKKRVGSLEETEDILHDVFYNLAKVDLLENPIEYISAWLYQSASNRIIDRGRKKKEQSLPEVREQDEDDYFLDSLSAILAGESDDPETILRNEIIREEVLRALAELPPEQRSIFELTEYEGFSYKEISASTGIPVTTLLSRKHYAVNKLQDKLAAFYADILL